MGRRATAPGLAGLGLLLLAAGSGADPAASWRCEASTGTGYWYDPVDGRWETLVFAVPGQDFLVRASGRPGVPWELVRGDAVLDCAGDFSAAGVLHCGPDDAFRLNREDLSFVSHLAVAAPGVPAELTAATVTGRCRP